MHICFERRGGFTGIPLSTIVDTATLPASEAKQVEQWVASANFFQLADQIFTSAQPDRFQYTITVDQDRRSHTVVVDESAVPDALRPLLTWLMEAARHK
jgi:hypothetical protein